MVNALVSLQVNFFIGVSSKRNTDEEADTAKHGSEVLRNVQKLIGTFNIDLYDRLNLENSTN